MAKRILVDFDSMSYACPYSTSSCEYDCGCCHPDADEAELDPKSAVGTPAALSPVGLMKKTWIIRIWTGTELNVKTSAAWMGNSLTMASMLPYVVTTQRRRMREGCCTTISGICTGTTRSG